MSDTKPTNPKDYAAVSKLDMSLVPTTGLIYEALAFTEGDWKYGGYNWREAGVKFSVYYAAFQRHAMKLLEGEWVDPQTSIPHIGSMKACCSILADAFEAGKLDDDRPPKINTLASVPFDIAEDKVKQVRRVFDKGPDRHTQKARDLRRKETK